MDILLIWEHAAALCCKLEYLEINDSVLSNSLLSGVNPTCKNLTGEMVSTVRGSCCFKSYKPVSELQQCLFESTRKVRTAANR